MAVRNILRYPDKRLRTKAKAVKVFDDNLCKLADEMAEAMYRGNGVGLAAPQVGIGSRVFVIDVANNEEDSPSDLKVFVNPEIVETSGEIMWSEGCLSFPGIREDIERFERVTVRAKNQWGVAFEIKAEGLLAVAIQHENDHLDGKLIIDRLGPLRRRLVHRSMTKKMAEASAS
jgi:peptide deformylase